MKTEEIIGRCLNGLGKAGRAYLPKVKELKQIWPADYREVNELLPIVLLVVILPPVIVISPSSLLRIILGLPLVLFLPGYTLMAALYVRKDRLRGLDRLALSLAASVAIVPLIGLVLNYLPVRISLTSFFLSIALFIFVASAVAWIRRGRLAAEERFTIRLGWRRPRLSGSPPDKALKVVMGLAAVAAVVSLVYVIVTPKTQDNFTEFYISGLEDKSVYPAELTAGEEQKVMVTIVNRERRTLDYLVEVSVDGVQEERTGPLTLADGQKYAAEMGFTPEAIGAGQEVSFTLYLNGETEPYLEPLRLWVDVK
jgi:uncharacterized membrane protein